MDPTTTSPTLATPRNMRDFEAANPTRRIPGSPIVLEGRRCFAISANDPNERASASSGDYFMLADDEPLRDSEGDPMVLAIERTRVFDAMSGELLYGV